MLQRLMSVGQNRYAGAAVAGGVAGIVLLILFLFLRGQRDTVVLRVQPIDDPSVVRVYVGGEVASPGLYSLPRGGRLAEALDAAGGVLPDADTSGLGMAAVVSDADQIIVPARRQASLPTATQPVPQPFAGVGPTETTQPVPTVHVDPPPVVTPVPAGPININAATVEELDQLPGIGPVIAGRIIDYRLQNGPFQTLEELVLITGISERMVDELHPLISLGY